MSYARRIDICLEAYPQEVGVILWHGGVQCCCVAMKAERREDEGLELVRLVCNEAVLLEQRVANHFAQYRKTESAGVPT